MVLPFWYRLTRVVPKKGPLNGCVRVCVCNILQMRPMSILKSALDSRETQRTFREEMSRWCLTGLKKFLAFSKFVWKMLDPGGTRLTQVHREHVNITCAEKLSNNTTQHNSGFLSLLCDHRQLNNCTNYQQPYRQQCR